ncbi:methanobactin export MATE transporter MbnM [Lujinxingia vulgaris]|uniref:methanobactin export MATE transporter MbnM n=1 Tax=Lujinxingia vulgaris TaxID=2600176 RepID=UPI001E2D6D93|nr:methanobactin export MATE transporter MbnM [Lujinxingia vulgaris]
MTHALRPTPALLLVLASALAAPLGCSEATSPEVASPPIPSHFPAPRIPPTNPWTVEKAELGRALFYDTRLSGNGTQSCSSCHPQSRAFTDVLPRAMGSTGEEHPRRSMTLTNVAWNQTYNWANPLVTTLEQQALTPLFGEHPVELGLAGREDELIARLQNEPFYRQRFAAAFPDADAPITLTHITYALASFQRTLVSGSSAFDRFMYEGDTSNFPESARRGMSLFFSERLECFHCHGGFNFSDATDHQGLTTTSAPFHVTGLYNIDGQGAYPAPNTGVHEVTGRPEDMGRFKAPTLRNVAVRAPYMHDGSVADLDAVIDHYAAGGRTIPDGPNAGVGYLNPNLSLFVPGFLITDEEREDLKAFLHSLTDHNFLTNPALGPPADLPPFEPQVGE